jgi:hypothetical protein
MPSIRVQAGPKFKLAKLSDKIARGLQRRNFMEGCSVGSVWFMTGSMALGYRFVSVLTNTQQARPEKRAY